MMTLQVLTQDNICLDGRDTAVVEIAQADLVMVGICFIYLVMELFRGRPTLPNSKGSKCNT